MFWNPVVLTWLRALAHLPLAVEHQEPIFIVGTGRSGTTLLGILLASHPRLAFLNEPKAAWFVANGDDDLIGTYTDAPGRYVLDEMDARPKAANRIRSIHSWYRRLAFGSRVVDKYPELVFRPRYVRSIFPKAKWVFVARNGWDTASSVGLWSDGMAKDRDGKREDWWGVDDKKWREFVAQIVGKDEEWAPRQAEILEMTDHRTRAVIEWIFSMEAGIALVRNKPESATMLRYEDLCERTEGELGGLFAFLGEPLPPQVVDFATARVTDSRRHGEFNLPAWIHPRFMANMHELGYSK